MIRNTTMAATKPGKNKAALQWLRSQSRPAQRWLLLSVALGLGSGALLICQADLISRISHLAIMEGMTRNHLVPLFFYLLAIVLIRALLGWCRETAGFRAGAAVREQVRKSILTRIVASGPVGISHLPTGSMISNALDQVEALHNFVARFLPQLALAALLPLVMLVFIFPVSWAVGGILLIAAPMIPFFMILVGMGAENISQKHFQALARMSAHFLDVLRGLPTLKQFGRSKDQAAQIQKTSQSYRKRTMAVLRMAFLSSAVLEFFSAISIALVAVYLGMYYLGYIDFGAYGRTLNFASGFFILLLAPDFFLPLRELGTHYHARADAVGAAEEILKIFDLSEMALPNSSEVAHIPSPPQMILFQNVSVQYDRTKHHALHEIDLTLAKGERVALVGESGAGKSTLIHLLMGFITPTSGRILINDVSLADVDLTIWRRHCAWIGQNPMLFTGTIRENIALSQPDASDRQIEKAAQKAGVMEFTDRWNMGMNTQVGELGVGLSVGQAQRVALARAFVTDAPLLLLDEPTASLDQNTENDILERLDSGSQGRTLLIATHRPAALALVDRIILLNKGKIVTQTDYKTFVNDHLHNQWLGYPA